MTTTATRSYADLFKEAAEAALAADPGADQDGGTCNFDSPAFRIEGKQQRTIEKFAAEAGLKVCDFQWLGGKRWYWLLVPLRGQGNRRTRMAEAAAKVLREAAESGEFPGLHACCYMQAD